MGEHDDRLLWEALLKQAEANLETARAMHLHTQHRLCQGGVVDMEPDRLEAWFAADCDAEAGAVIAEQIVQQAKGFWQDDQQTVGSTAALGNAGGKHVGKQVVGTKRRVPSVFDLLVKQPPRGADIEVASITAESGRATSGDGEADEARDGADKGRVANKPTTAKSGKQAAAEKDATKKTAAAKAAAQQAAAEKAAAEKTAVEKPAAEEAAVKKAAAEKVAADKAAAEKAAAMKAAAEKAAAEKILAEKVAAQKAAAEKVEEPRKAETQGPGLLKTLAGTGLQANPRAEWTHTEPYMWADISSDGKGDSGDDGCPKSAKPKLEEDRLTLEKLKLRICELGGDPGAANIHGPEDSFRCGDCGGAVDKIAAGYFGCEGCDWVGVPLPPPPKGKGKGKKRKGGRAGQQRAQR
jgi:hypothetical protein